MVDGSLIDPLKVVKVAINTLAKNPIHLLLVTTSRLPLYISTRGYSVLPERIQLNLGNLVKSIVDEVHEVVAVVDILELLHIHQNTGHGRQSKLDLVEWLVIN